MGIFNATEIKNKLQKDLVNSINNNIDDGDTKVVEKDPKPVKLQIGPNQGDNLEIKLTDARTSSIEVDDIKVTSSKESQAAIESIDKAINDISSERSKFGSYENRLDHIQSNVSNYDTNISQANSRIKDADMAQEKMELTKSQILQQSAQALLSQAMMIPQGVLQMLPSDM